MLDTILSQPPTESVTRLGTTPGNTVYHDPNAALLEVATYYADQNYITMDAQSNGSSYALSGESIKGGAVDWVGRVSRLDPMVFSSLSDLQSKISSNRTLYDNELPP